MKTVIDSVPLNADLNKEPTFEEIQKSIDLIPNELLKHENVMHLMHGLFSLCWRSKMVPDQWRQAIIHPIPKTSTKSIDPLKYRGLALQSCVCKILCDIINDHIVNHLDNEDLIADEHNGFRKGRSCSHHIHTLLTTVRNRLTERKDTHACFIDFSKAFDDVDRKLLICKLVECKIVGPILDLIKQLYSNTTNYVRLNGRFSDGFSSENGVMQGNNLSPTLFSVFINGLLQELSGSAVGIKLGSMLINHLAYADDIVLLAENESDLQQLLDVAENWCKKWRIKVNISKSKTIHFRNKNQQCGEFRHQFGGELLEQVKSYKYLGVTLDEYLMLDNAVEQLAAAGSRALGYVIGKTKNNIDLGFHSFETLFRSCVAPILDYASGAWSVGHDCVKIKQVQLRAIRYYCGLPRTTPIVGMISEMGWIPSVVRRDLESVRLYNQYVRMPAEQLNKKVFEFDMDKQAKGSWSRNLYCIAEHTGCTKLVDARKPLSIELMKDKLLRMYCDTVKRGIEEKPKLRTFCKIKENFETESYLRLNLDKHKRSLIGQLTLGV